MLGNNLIKEQLIPSTDELTPLENPENELKVFF